MKRELKTKYTIRVIVILKKKNMQITTKSKKKRKKQEGVTRKYKIGNWTPHCQYSSTGRWSIGATESCMFLESVYKNTKQAANTVLLNLTGWEMTKRYARITCITWRHPQKYKTGNWHHIVRCCWVWKVWSGTQASFVPFKSIRIL